jgi:hypothetical protein
LAGKYQRPGRDAAVPAQRTGRKYGISVTVTDIDAGDVNFDFKVDDQPS